MYSLLPLKREKSGWRYVISTPGGASISGWRAGSREEVADHLLKSVTRLNTLKRKLTSSYHSAPL